MQFFAAPMVLPAAFATVSMGRDGSRKYPPTAVATCRKNIRRPMCGRRQKCVPLTCDQSTPKRSFMTDTSIAEQEIDFVDERPRQIFDVRVLQRRCGGL